MFPLVDFPKRFSDFFFKPSETNLMSFRTLHRPPLTRVSTAHLHSFQSCNRGVRRTHHTQLTFKSIWTWPVSYPSVTSIQWHFATFHSVVFNNSLISGVFPSVYKSDLVKPFWKKMSLGPSDLKNYRPVSKLSFPSNIVERIVLPQLNEHPSCWSSWYHHL